MLALSALPAQVLNDGRRQIGAFYFPGDIFGLEPGDDQHASSAEAIGDVTVLVFKRSAVLALSARDADVARGAVLGAFANAIIIRPGLCLAQMMAKARFARIGQLPSAPKNEEATTPFAR